MPQWIGVRKNLGLGQGWGTSADRSEQLLQFPTPLHEGWNSIKAGDLAPRVHGLQLRGSAGLSPASPFVPCHPGQWAPWRE